MWGAAGWGGFSLGFAGGLWQVERKWVNARFQANYWKGGLVVGRARGACGRWEACGQGEYLPANTSPPCQGEVGCPLACRNMPSGSSVPRRGPSRWGQGLVWQQLAPLCLLPGLWAHRDFSYHSCTAPREGWATPLRDKNDGKHPKEQELALRRSVHKDLASFTLLFWIFSSLFTSQFQFTKLFCQRTNKIKLGSAQGTPWFPALLSPLSPTHALAPWRLEMLHSEAPGAASFIPWAANNASRGLGGRTSQGLVL